MDLPSRDGRTGSSAGPSLTTSSTKNMVIVSVAFLLILGLLIWGILAMLMREEKDATTRNMTSSMLPETIEWPQKNFTDQPVQQQTDESPIELNKLPITETSKKEEHTSTSVQSRVSSPAESGPIKVYTKQLIAQTPNQKVEYSSNSQEETFPSEELTFTSQEQTPPSEFYNFGALGKVLRQEQTHGLLKKPINWGEYGQFNPKQMWTRENYAHFNKQAIVRQFDDIALIPITLFVSNQALRNNIESGRCVDHSLFHTLIKVNQFTPWQQFLIASAQSICRPSKSAEQMWEYQKTAPLPLWIRNNKVLGNFDRFAEAFNNPPHRTASTSVSFGD